MIDLIWQSMKQQNLLHIGIYLLLNVIGFVVIVRHMSRTKAKFSKAKRVLLLFLIWAVCILWAALIRWADNTHTNDLHRQGIFVTKSLWVFFFTLLPTGLLGGWGTILILTILQPTEYWDK